MNKPAGRHKAQQLTVRRIESLTKPGKYLDGEGLHLQVYNSNSKTWIVRCTIRGQLNSQGKPLRREFGLGSYKQVSLSKAREKARAYVACAREGKDPSVELRHANYIPTFETVAQEYLELRLKQPVAKGGWRNAKHKQQWQNSLKQHVYPAIGSRRIDQITTPEIQNLLTPLWYSTHETARRLKQRINAVFQYAKGKGHLSAGNPVADLSFPKKRITEVEHFKACKWQELPEFMKWLRDVDTPVMSRLALEFLILTAARTGEVTGAKWSEIDMGTAVWTRPASRMKAKKPHLIPLPPRCIEILEYLQPITRAGGYVFDGPKAGKPISNMAMLTLLRRNNWEFTVHGFRSSFRDWADEMDNPFSHAAIEKCLAHELSKVESAYARGDLLEKRLAILKAWEIYALSEVNDAGNVVQLKAGA